MTRRALAVGVPLATLAAMWLLAEVLLGVWRPGIATYRDLVSQTRAPAPAAYSPDVAFTLPPSQVIEGQAVYTINERGFRGRVVAPPGPGGPQRVVVFGDSYTFGLHVEDDETFPAHLDELFARHGPPADVINAAYHAGYSPDSYYVSLRNEWDYYQADVVVVALCMWNDIPDVGGNRWPETDDEGRPLRVQTERNYANWEGRSIFLEGNDYPLSVFAIPVLRHSRLLSGLEQFYRTAMSDEVFPSVAETHRRGRERFPRMLRAIHDFASSRGARLLFVVIPPYTVPVEAPPVDDATDFALGIVRDDLGVQAIDMREVYRLEPDPSRLFLAGDGHYTSLGNRRVAEAVYHALRRPDDADGLPPPAGPVARVTLEVVEAAVPLGGAATVVARGWDREGRPVPDLRFTWERDGAPIADTSYGVARITAIWTPTDVTARTTSGVGASRAIVPSRDGTLVADAFGGEDGGALASRAPDVGPPPARWIVPAGAPVLRDAAVGLPSRDPDTVFLQAFLDSGAADGWIGVDWRGGQETASGYPMGGVTFRVRDPQNFWAACYGCSSHPLGLWKVVDGEWTLVRAVDPRSASERTRRLEVRLSDSVIEVWSDGLRRIRTQDDFAMEATRHGVGWSPAWDWTTAFDNFSVFQMPDANEPSGGGRP